MKRNIKKEVIIVDGREITFMSFAQVCYNRNKPSGGFEWYVTKNMNSLKIGWDAISDAAEKGHIKNLEKNHHLISSTIDTIKKLVKSIF